jgi:hypothetical protein
MKIIVYTKLKRQIYFSLGNISVEQARNIFRFRVRMAAYGENVRGNKENVTCSLCHLHFDSQAMGFQCQEIKTKDTH